MIDVPDTLHSHRERGRLTAQGRCTDDDSACTLLVIHETGGSWAIHGLGAPGVRLSKAEMVALAEKILDGTVAARYGIQSTPHPLPAAT